LTSSGFREEVFNVLLAQLLAEREVVSVPEQALRLPGIGRRMPDVLVIFQGLRTIIEGKVDDHPGAPLQAIADASGRVEEGIAHIGIAVLYPAELRNTATVAELRGALSRRNFKITICTEDEQQGWIDGNLDYLASLLRRTFDQLVREDVVSQAVAALEAGVDNFAAVIQAYPAVIDRCAQVLGVGEVVEELADES
jgi:hypothetical protein